jgi:putative IMPACT (imprinted ancient) family translation regulator
MLQQLEREDLFDVLAAVVRHFGGVKLGVGGLVRAYSDAVGAALERASIVVRKVLTPIRVTYPPNATSAVMRTVHRFGANIGQIEYDAQATAIVTVPPSRVGAFREALREATGGTADAEVLT